MRTSVAAMSVEPSMPPPPWAELYTSMVKTPILFDEITILIRSNCRGENWSMESNMPFIYRSCALYLKEPNCGGCPDLCKSRRWKNCLVKGMTKRRLGLRETFIRDL